MPPHPIRAIWILSLVDVRGAIVCPAIIGVLSPATAAELRNSRRVRTSYFVSERLDFEPDLGSEEGVEVEGAGVADSDPLAGVDTGFSDLVAPLSPPLSFA